METTPGAIPGILNDQRNQLRTHYLARWRSTRVCVRTGSFATPSRSWNERRKVNPVMLQELLIELGYITATQADRPQEEHPGEQGRRPIRSRAIRSWARSAPARWPLFYKAKQLSLATATVAIKVLPRRFSENPEYVQRFYKEGQAAGKLNHPNIVQAIDVGEAGGLSLFRDGIRRRQDHRRRHCHRPVQREGRHRGHHPGRPCVGSRPCSRPGAPRRQAEEHHDQPAGCREAGGHGSGPRDDGYRGGPERGRQGLRHAVLYRPPSRFAARSISMGARTSTASAPRSTTWSPVRSPLSGDDSAEIMKKHLREKADSAGPYQYVAVGRGL